MSPQLLFLFKSGVIILTNNQLHRCEARWRPGADETTVHKEISWKRNVNVLVSAALSGRSSIASRKEGVLPRPKRERCIDRTLIACSYKLVAIKLMTPSKEHLEKHYEDLSDKPFFKGLVACSS